MSVVDTSLLEDFCVVVARIAECERTISLEGMLVPAHRGALRRHPASVAVAGYRSQLRYYIGELGLSRASRRGLPAPPPDPDDSWRWGDFDAPGRTTVRRCLRGDGRAAPLGRDRAPREAGFGFFKWVLWARLSVPRPPRLAPN